METSLLTTKLYIPSPRSSLVTRPRLIERVDEGLRLGRKLTLLSAPAGFGKTTLLSEWAAHSTVPVAWVSLDEGDNDPTRFWSYIIAALQTVQADIGVSALAALRSPQSPSSEPFLADIINEVAAIQNSSVLILDDYHIIKRQPIHAALTFFLEHLPPQMHLVVSSRTNPPWPLARMRARDEITEIRADDLRFTLTEATAFLNDTMGLRLSQEDVDTLDARTEGWIAGLQMAALSMQGRKDATAFIKAFSGSHRFILDYLVEEVLERQSQNVQDFLLRTSILDRLTAPLCDVVAARDDSQAMLVQLEQANLFVMPLDDERRWYRYHHLFADLLSNRLHQTSADLVPSLNRRASEWYAQNGLITEAVSHALEAGDIQQATRLVEENAFALVYHSELAALVGLLDMLPGRTVRLRPRLCIARAWALAYTGQVDAVEPLVLDAEKALGEIEDQTEIRRIAGRVAFLRAYVAAFRGDMSRAGGFASQALDHLPEDDMPVRGFAAALLGVVRQVSGDLVSAAAALEEAAASSLAAGDSCTAVDVICDLVGLQVAQGQLRRAVANCEDALQLADECVKQVGRRPPVVGYVYLRLASILRERNELETALHYATNGFELYRRWGQPDYSRLVYGEMAKIRQAIGDSEGALDAVREAKRAASGLSPRVIALVAALEARIQLAQGDIATASRWAQESRLSVDDELDYQSEVIYRNFARILVAQGRPGQALRLLGRLLEVVETAGAAGTTIEVWVYRALALQALGDQDQALTALEHALSLAEPEGYMRIFIDEGAPMGRLLRQAIARGVATDYARYLLSALETKADHRQPQVELVEPLSEREFEVLQFLPTNLTAPQIARKLHIAPTTVRTHIKNIYGKLGVHSRMEAITRAKKLKLLT
jgi:LuxR family maltose regulon positive regulatory protein